jgi:hypothetical protein
VRVIWPLVGRAEELALLHTALGAAPSGAVLSGPAGVGKTRLAAELAAWGLLLGRAMLAAGQVATVRDHLNQVYDTGGPSN